MGCRNSTFFTVAEEIDSQTQIWFQIKRKSVDMEGYSPADFGPACKGVYRFFIFYPESARTSISAVCRDVPLEMS